MFSANCLDNYLSIPYNTGCMGDGIMNAFKLIISKSKVKYLVSAD